MWGESWPLFIARIFKGGGGEGLGLSFLEFASVEKVSISSAPIATGSWIKAHPISQSEKVTTVILTRLPEVIMPVSSAQIPQSVRYLDSIF